MKKTFDELKKSKEKLLGTFIQSASPELVEIAGYAGFDFVVMDMEHSPFTMESTLHMIRAAEAADILPLVRVPKTSAVYVKKALDMGAAGIIFPNIDSAEEAEKAIHLSKFYPNGKRGACPGARANHYGESGIEYYAKANQETAVILLVESAEGIHNFDEILATSGISAVFLGPVDLSVSMGFQGDVTRREVEETIALMIQKANEKNIFVGVLSMNVTTAKKLYHTGADFVAFGIDTMLFYEKCKEVKKAVLPCHK